MKSNHGAEFPSAPEWEPCSAETLDAIRNHIRARDVKQAEILALIATPGSLDRQLITAWFALALAQGELSQLLNNEVQKRTHP
jgi:hypothetical protein